MSQEASEMAGWPLPKQGEFVWTEIGTSDADKCQAFYEAVFDWKFHKGQADPAMDYREFSIGGGDRPGGRALSDRSGMVRRQPSARHYLTYVAVDDVDASAELAESLGGSVHKKMDIPNVGRMAIIQDRRVR